MAAYWSISWPALIVSVLLASMMTDINSVGGRHFASVITGFFGFFGAQAVLAQRLIRKHYRSFRIYVIRDDGQQGHKLSWREIGLVSLCIVGFQLAFIVLWLVVVYASDLAPERMSAASTLELWFRFFVSGPYAIGLALRIRYPGFRLQTSGFRYI